MALVLNDRVQETCSAPGTGAATLLGAVTGFQTFSSGVGNGNTCYYCIADQGGANWEVGLGTYSSSGNTLTRTTPYSGSAATPVNFSSGVQTVFVTYPAEKKVILDATGNTTALGTVSSGVWEGTTVAVLHGGTGVTTSTGSGDNVLSTNPVLTTPNLGTPSAVNLTNGTALPLTTGVSGVLPTANGGTNLSTFTSGGAVYATSTSALTTGTLPIASGGTNQTSFTAPSGTVSGLVFFNGTGLANDATVTDVGYNTSTNTLVANKITAGGLIESTLNGFKFPDGTTQTTAATAGVSQAKATAIAMIFGL